MRDYIHVVDLALGPIKALETLGRGGGVPTYNLGTGKGYSVLEVLAAFEKASGREIPRRITPRRHGDAAITYADPSRARTEFAWSAERDLEQMCADAWNWQRQNPEGYTRTVIG